MVQFNHKDTTHQKELVIDEYKIDITKPVFLDSETLKPYLSYAYKQTSEEKSKNISCVYVDDITFNTNLVPLPRFLQSLIKDQLCAYVEEALNKQIKHIQKGSIDRQKQRVQDVWSSILDDYPNRSTVYNALDKFIELEMKDEILKQAIQNLTTLFHADSALSNFHQCSDGRSHYLRPVRFNAFDNELKISTGYEENSYLVGGFDVYFNMI